VKEAWLPDEESQDDVRRMELLDVGGEGDDLEAWDREESESEMDRDSEAVAVQTTRQLEQRQVNYM